MRTTRHPTAPAPDSDRWVPLALAVSPQGAFYLDSFNHSTSDTASDASSGRLPSSVADRITAAFSRSLAQGLIHLGTAELSTDLPASLALGRELAKLFFTRLCAVPDLEAQRDHLAVPAPLEELEALAASAPPMLGGEYLSVGALAGAWSRIEAEVKGEIAAFSGPLQGYLQGKSAVWNVVGRVCFHLAENRGDERKPFAFMATYATRLSKEARVQHAPLGRAIEELAGVGDGRRLLALLEPVQRAAEKSAFLKQLVDSSEIFHPLAWTAKEAYAFLQDTAELEASGVVVRVPAAWRTGRPPRPLVKVTLGRREPGGVGADAVLDFDVKLALEDEEISRAEWERLLSATEPLVRLGGRWVEVDPDKLREVLERWKAAERAAAREGVSFFEGMRLLAGVAAGEGGETGDALDTPGWAKVEAGAWLEGVLSDLKRPEGSREADPGVDLKGTLRPYQRDGVAWLWLLSRLGLGACLADDMGLGKTIQVLSLFLLLKKKRAPGPHLLVVPASLLGNWRAEMERFAPSLRMLMAHPSEMSPAELSSLPTSRLDEADVVLTTYKTVLRMPWITERAWGVVVLDEAQAIKNPGAKQTRSVKALRSTARVALTGTPVENRLGDLWSIFDFLCPGLLGSAEAFRRFSKQIGGDPRRGYAPLRNLLRPYILRRLKSDKRVITDLPDKTEVYAYCPLTKTQAALYAQAVQELAARLADPRLEEMQRRGLVLAYLMRLKQVCNHPSQWLGDGVYRPGDSGKHARLRELCEPISARQEKVLVFTQFREMIGPVSSWLEGIFGRPGLALHGETAVKKRASLVAEFQREDGPPFFVLSLRAGGTGLNLTAASHVIHFDRWWNPAVEGQATDRAYRIGQKKNVLVHKLVCRGTIEEKIDGLIEAKRGLSEALLAGGGEAWLTEMKSDELLRLVSLDLRSALDNE